MPRTARLTPLLLALLATAPSWAQPPAAHGARHDAMFATMDADHDGRISAREHAAAAQAMFARADADHDGYVSFEEMQAAHGRGGPAAMTPATPASAPPADGQGAGTGAPATPAAAAPPMPGMDHEDAMPANGGMHHDMGMRDHFRAMDADGDGRLSAAEHAAGAARMFAAMDTDHDGGVSRAEFDAGHPMMGAPMMGSPMPGGMPHDGMPHDGMHHDGMPPGTQPAPAGTTRP